MVGTTPDRWTREIYYRTTALADALDISRQRLARWRRNGWIPDAPRRRRGVKPCGDRRLYTADEIEVAVRIAREKTSSDTGGATTLANHRSAFGLRKPGDALDGVKRVKPLRRLSLDSRPQAFDPESTFDASTERQLRVPLERSRVELPGPLRMVLA